MASLNGIGVLKYNGLTFNGPMVSSKVSMEPVRGDDDRAVIYTNVSIEVTALLDIEQCGVAQADLTGTTYLEALEMFRHMLSQSGKPLYFEDKIFGRFRVNTGVSGDLIDVNYGPRVTLSSITPVGANRAFEVSWRVVAAVGECPTRDGDGLLDGGTSSEYAIGDVKQVCYEVSWSTDVKGYSQRSVSGFIEIVQAPAMNGDVLTITADDYRERLTVSLPLGFARTTNSYTLNTRRDRIQFSIVDEEIKSPHAYPPDVSEIEITHEASVGRPFFSKAVSVISGYCEVCAPFTASYAHERLYPIVVSRIQAARATAGPVFLQSAMFKEHLYSPRVDFRVEYYQLQSSLLGFALDSGMFSEFSTGSKANWENWRQSMYGPDEDTNSSGVPFARRGIADLSFEPTDDVIVTPCQTQPISVTVHNNRILTNPIASISRLANICPPRDKSYIDYQSALVTVSKPGTASLTELPTESYTYTPGIPKPSSGESLTNATNTEAQTRRTFESNASAPKVEMILEGHAARLGFAVELPEVAASWTQDVSKVPSGSYIKNSSRNHLGCKVYMTAWKIRYLITQNLVDTATSLGDLHDKLFITTDATTGTQGENQ